MSNYEMCKRHCANGNDCLMPDDFTLALNNVETSIEGHTPQRIDHTNFGAELGEYCLHLAKYTDTLAQMAPLFEGATPALDSPATSF